MTWLRNAQAPKVVPCNGVLKWATSYSKAASPETDQYPDHRKAQAWQAAFPDLKFHRRSPLNYIGHWGLGDRVMGILFFMLIVLAIGFASGFGVRDMISRRRRAQERLHFK